jgi:hypothetical protein
MIKVKGIMQSNKIIIPILILCIILSYHFFIQNKIEKIFFEKYLNYDNVKRPLEKCNNKIINNELKCFGMPSGNAEIVTIFSALLYYYKYISFDVCIIIILLFSSQRYISGMHTVIQIIIGILFGLFYSSIYIYGQLSIYSFLIVFIIGFIMSKFAAYKNFILPYSNEIIR